VLPLALVAVAVMNEPAASDAAGLKVNVPIPFASVVTAVYPR
jgi:hypothetical protein